MSFQTLFDFESALAEYTGAPYVVVTDGCTHAIELCMRYDQVKQTQFTAFTYLSVPMLMHHLNICYELVNEKWTGEYQFIGTRIWDSARLLKEGMYRAGQLQCLSFGYTKPLEIGRGGAVLTDDVEIYDILSQQRYDGRVLNISPWENQKVFRVGYHYKPTVEEAIRGLELLPTINQTPKYHQYPDLREIIIK